MTKIFAAGCGVGTILRATCTESLRLSGKEKETLSGYLPSSIGQQPSLWGSVSLGFLICSKQGRRPGGSLGANREAQAGGGRLRVDLSLGTIRGPTGSWGLLGRAHTTLLEQDG